MSSIKYWKQDELLAILAAARRESVRNHCMILFAYTFGLRANEVATLTVQNVQTGRLVCKTQKNSLPVDAVIESNEIALLDAKKALQSWLRVRPQSSDNSLFVSRLGKGMRRLAVYEIFVNAAAAAGIEAGRRNPHCAKHSVIRHGWEAGLDVFTLQQIGHHRDLKATAAYTAVTQDEARSKASAAMAASFAKLNRNQAEAA
jgi:site-specific recombinase XerD